MIPNSTQKDSFFWTASLRTSDLGVFFGGPGALSERCAFKMHLSAVAIFALAVLPEAFTQSIQFLAPVNNSQNLPWFWTQGPSLSCSWCTGEPQYSQ